jgi:hypothetical protein
MRLALPPPDGAKEAHASLRSVVSSVIGLDASSTFSALRSPWMMFWQD